MSTLRAEAAPTSDDGPRIRRVLREEECLAATGLSRWTRQRMTARGEFPRSVPLGRKGGIMMRGWWADEVAEWQRQRDAERKREAAA